MRNMLQMKDLALSRLIVEISNRCTEEQRRLVENGSFSTFGPLGDSQGGRGLLSSSQLIRLRSLGILDETPPLRGRVIKGVVECAWYFADPASYPPEIESPDGLRHLSGRLIYHAIVIGNSGEVLGEWRLDWARH